MTLGLAIYVSYLCGKKFMDTEQSKLQSNGKMDRIVVLVSGIILSMLIMAIFIMCLDIPLEYHRNGTDKISGSYSQLMIFFSVLLMTSYSASKLCLFGQKSSAAPINSIHRKIIRLVVLSFIMIMGAVLKPAWNGIFCGIAILYYFLEMLCARKLIAEILDIKTPSKQSFSLVLTSYLNGKIVFLSLLGMIEVTFLTNAKPQLFFIDSLGNIYGIVGMLFLVQLTTSWMTNKFMEKLQTVQSGIHTKSSVEKRQKNLIWICDVTILMLYLLGSCMLLKYIGINLQEHIFQAKIATTCVIAFLTILIYRGYHEFADALLEKARKGKENDNKIKLETFLPAMSTLFCSVLLATSSLLILANLGINIAPILATFTIFTAAIGLAAKDIIQSFLHGIMYLIEKDLYVGAYVQINGCVGVIEKLTIRAMYMRRDDGSLSIIPYNTIGIVTNFSQNYSIFSGYLRINVGDDVEKISQIFRQVAEDMRKEQTFKNVILESLEICGLKPFDLTGPQIYWKLKTSSDINGQLVRYEIFRRLYKEYQKVGVILPETSLVVS